MKSDEKIEIKTEWIKLDSLLKFSGVSETGGDAKLLINEGNISVNGDICRERGKKIKPGDIVVINNKKITVVREEK